MVLLLECMVLAVIYIINPGCYSIYDNRCPFCIDLPYSVYCLLNVSFIYSSILCCLSVFQVINDHQQVVL